MTRARLTPEQRRERNRLRSLRWRRAHGIGPRKPAARPWLALGLSRSNLLPEAGEGPRAGRIGGTRGGARSLGLADCRAARVARQDGCGERGDGGGVELSAKGPCVTDNN
jgi:hypothetical protein